MPVESKKVSNPGTLHKMLSERTELRGRKSREAPWRKQSIPVGVYICARVWRVHVWCVRVEAFMRGCTYMRGCGAAQ